MSFAERPTVEIASLSRSEQADLLDFIAEDAVAFEKQSLPPGQLGDPTLVTALILLNMTTITGICAWLASRGKNVSLDLNFKVPGFESGMKFNISGDTPPADVRAHLSQQGVQVPDS